VKQERRRCPCAKRRAVIRANIRSTMSQRTIFRSPFRYPGGKSWLIPEVRAWLGALPFACNTLVEPFAGGASIGLMAVFDGLAKKAVLVELDENIAAVWQSILNGGANALADEILGFSMSTESVERALSEADRSTKHRAFATIVRNRISRGGVMAPRAGRLNRGENGRGLNSRWYPETLARRIRDIAAVRDRIEFIHGDGIDYMGSHGEPSAAYFIDPPYVGAGRRLYKHSAVDHDAVFAAAGNLGDAVFLTYDDTETVRSLARQNSFEYIMREMRTAHHATKRELLISRGFKWLSTEVAQLNDVSPEEAQTGWVDSGKPNRTTACSI
jgi:DNA adenine methylase